MIERPAPRLLSPFNLVLAVMAAALLLLLTIVTGQVEENDGRGWDGDSYVRLMEGDTRGVPQNVYLRGGVILANRPLYLLTRDWRLTVSTMNVAYATLVAIFAGAIFSLYSGDATGKGVMIASIALSIATAKAFAYYPAMIDLGAYAALLAAVYAVLRWPPAAVALCCSLAVVSREFGIFVCAFGLTRYLRERRGVVRTLATFAAPVAAWLLLRLFVSRIAVDAPMLTPGTLLSNLRYWTHPPFVAFQLYFACTIVGGLVLAAVAVPGPWLARLRREPEWAWLIGLPLLAGAVGSFDIWRYQAYMLPAVPVLFAAVLTAIPQPRRGPFLAVVLTATLVTQRPWQHLDEIAYFRDWFPYYALMGAVPNEGTLPVWPLWAWRMALALAFLVVLALIGRRGLAPKTADALQRA